MAAETLQLRASTFHDGDLIPSQHAGEGNDTAVELQWTNAPAGTRSFVLLVEDPDAPNGTFVHWLRYDVPATARAVKTNESEIGLEGLNDFDTTAWRGPAPPPDHGQHRYFFRLFALDVPTLDLPEGARADAVQQRMQGHVVGRAELVGRYGSSRTPAGQMRPDLQRLFWGAFLVFVLGGVLLLALGIAGIFLAPLLGSIAIVMLLIWGWRRMADRKPPLGSQRRAAPDARHPR